MITTKVFRVKSDVKTRCHCGHEVSEGEEYFVVRTSVPKWVSLCPECVHMLSQPIEVDMPKLKEMWAWERPKIREAVKPKLPPSDWLKRGKQKGMSEKDLEVAVWV